MPMTFTCLNPRKFKKRQMETMLEGRGILRFLRMAPLGFRSYPETGTRAAMALKAATKPPRSMIMKGLKLWLFKRQYAGSRAYFVDHPNTVAVAWSGVNGTRRVYMDAAKDAGNKTLYFELSPFEGRVTIDPEGVNFTNALPRNPSPYIAWAVSSDANPLGWHSMRDAITQRKPAAHYVRSDVAPPMVTPFIFVPLQAPGDSQMRLYGGEFKRVDGFVEAILQAARQCPDGWQVRIKEHPTEIPFVKDIIDKAGLDNVVLDNTTDTFEQVKQASIVITVNSSVGLQALFFDKPVIACGDCFWAIEGVATTAKTAQDIANLFAKPDDATFDTQTRYAFLNYLDQCYYPKLSAPESAGNTTEIANYE